MLKLLQRKKSLAILCHNPEYISESTQELVELMTQQNATNEDIAKGKTVHYHLTKIEFNPFYLLTAQKIICPPNVDDHKKNILALEKLRLDVFKNVGDRQLKE